MAKYRAHLPFEQKRFFLTDGGMETDFIFNKGIDLPHFAAFPLLNNPPHKNAVEDYFKEYFDIAKKYDTGFILGGLTWRANNDWGVKFGLESPQAVDTLNKEIIKFLVQLRSKYETSDFPIIISGSLGPRGDGYDPGSGLSIEQAEQYHSAQIGSFHDCDVDIITALTMNNCLETVGIVKAAMKMSMPIAVSFTVETDGNLPTGQALKNAIEEVDAATQNYPSFYMINCAHPTHFEQILRGDGLWVKRIRGIRANASRCSHAELDEATNLDDGNPAEFGSEYKDILSRNSHINILGGCCGTDHRHIEEAIKDCLKI